jgi:Family of unknown function (DUF5715)
MQCCLRRALLVLVFPLAAVAGSPTTPLTATRLSPLVQNRQADREDLSRMRNRAMIQRFEGAGYLVRVQPQTKHYYLRSIPAGYRYLRPWSKTLLERLGRQFHVRFHKRLRVTSLVRTVASQRQLAKRNGNAAPANGPRRSSHLTGATLDISKKNMTLAERQWVRRVLRQLRGGGYLYAVEEFQQPVFHIMVYRSYLDYVEFVKASSGAQE